MIWGLFPAAPPVSFEHVLAGQVVLDLHSLPNDTIKGAMAELLILRLHGHLLRGEQPRKLTRLLVIDEAWRLAESKHLAELAREGRAFGVGIAIGTQFPGDVPETMSGNLETQVFLFNKEYEHRRAVIRALVGRTSGHGGEQLQYVLGRLRQHQAVVKNSAMQSPVVVDLVPHYARADRGVIGTAAVSED